MRILVLSKEAWRDDQNGGNVLSNIFSGFHAEFAQITCAAAKPSNSLCKKYFQMTDSMMMDYCRHLGNSNTIGRERDKEMDWRRNSTHCTGILLVGCALAHKAFG